LEQSGRCGEDLGVLYGSSMACITGHMTKAKVGPLGFRAGPEAACVDVTGVRSVWLESPKYALKSGGRRYVGRLIEADLSGLNTLSQGSSYGLSACVLWLVFVDSSLSIRQLEPP
jgi:hypothetical protein